MLLADEPIRLRIDTERWPRILAALPAARMPLTALELHTGSKTDAPDTGMPLCHQLDVPVRHALETVRYRLLGLCPHALSGVSIPGAAYALFIWLPGSAPTVDISTLHCSALVDLRTLIFLACSYLQAAREALAEVLADRFSSSATGCT